MRARYAALVGFFVALAAVHAIVAFWTPVQGNDWTHWIWAGRHDDDKSWLLSWLGAHFTFSDAMGYMLARCRAVHVLVTPIVVTSLVIGLFTLAMRRLPRATYADLLGLMLVSALVWIGQPFAGVALFHTPYVAQYVYGAAVAVWIVAPLRCGWQVPRAVWPVVALAGYCAGSSSRAIGLATLVGVVAMVRAVPRERCVPWMWITVGAVFAGVVVGYASPPWLEFARVFRRGLEQNLTGSGLLRYALQETGEVIAFVSAFVLANLVLRALGRRSADDAMRPEAIDTLRWLLGSFGVSVWCLFGPGYNETTLVPVTCMLVVAALPHLAWLATVPSLRILLVATAIGVHAIAWTSSITTYQQMGREGRERLAILEATKPGTVARISHYSQVPPDFWFVGEDLGSARLRELVAIECFHLLDIVFDPPFRRLEPNPGISLELEIEGATTEQVAAARPPATWASELSAARKQFEPFAKRLRALNKTAAARLLVKNVEFPQRRQRPLLAAWVDAKDSVIPRVRRSAFDDNGRYTVRVYKPHASRFNEAWIVENGAAISVPYREGAPRLQPMTADLNVVVVCNQERCLVADAFVPRF